MPTGLLSPAPQWEHSFGPLNQVLIPGQHEFVTLVHGCTSADLAAIKSATHHIQVAKGSPNTDFGRGFYTTTLFRQARHWAWHRLYSDNNPAGNGVGNAVILNFKIPRLDLADQQALTFVSGSYDAEGFWSLVQHCRQGGNHKCPRFPQSESDEWYDVVMGPVAAFWQQRVAMVDSDQISFHTQSVCNSLLNPLIDGALHNASFKTDRFEVFQI